MHDTVMLVSVCCALLKEAITALNRSNKRPRWRRGFVVFLRSSQKWTAAYITLHVVIVMALVRGVSSGGGIFAAEFDKWQFTLMRKLPSRVLSRLWKSVAQVQLAPWSRRPLLGILCAMFGINLKETRRKNLSEFSSLHALFVRRLREETRPICPDHCVVSPADGRVLHVGQVRAGAVKQVKGVSYRLEDFLGPNPIQGFQSWTGDCGNAKGEIQRSNSWTNLSQSFPHLTPSKGNELFHAVVYLSMADYHHFHSPADWTLHIRRHIAGELLSVAPWVVRQLPSLFSLSERVVLGGYWEHGFFSLTAVGAYNVGSIEIDLDQDLKTNVSDHEDENGDVKMGEFSDKLFQFEGIPVHRGEHLGFFGFGSTVVLVFEAPKSFEFAVKAGDHVKFGQPMGNFLPKAHLDVYDE